MRKLLTVLMLLLPFDLMGAPFCVQLQGITPMCDYVDAGSCQRRATELGGICTANAKETNILKGNAKFCVVDSSKVADCFYPDRATCIREAERRRASCLEKPDELIQRDPYRQVPNRNY